jgi:hypothetical protein
MNESTAVENMCRFCRFLQRICQLLISLHEKSGKLTIIIAGLDSVSEHMFFSMNGSDRLQHDDKRLSVSYLAFPEPGFWQINSKSGDLQFCLALQGTNCPCRTTNNCVRLDWKDAKPL